MTPKKAIIIVLGLFLIVILTFAFLYLKKQLAVSPIELPRAIGQNDATGGANTGAALEPTEEIQQKINKIIEEAKKNPKQNTPEKVRQDVVGAINAEIIKQENNKTPEQKAAEEKVQAERQKTIDQINNQVKQ